VQQQPGGCHTLAWTWEIKTLTSTQAASTPDNTKADPKCKRAEDSWRTCHGRPIYLPARYRDVDCPKASLIKEGEDARQEMARELVSDAEL